MSRRPATKPCSIPKSRSSKPTACRPDRKAGATVPLTSRETAKLFDHCTIAIDWTLQRFGRNGLPLMGSGDWDDGMNLIGFEGRGESVWVGFFLHGILIDFARVCDKRGKRKIAERYRQEAEKLRDALDKCWRGDRYVRAFSDNGREVAPMSAMTASWPVLSRAVDFERGSRRWRRRSNCWRGRIGSCW